MPQSDTITLKSLYTAIAAQIAKGAGTFNLVPDVCSSDAIGKFYSGVVPGGVFTISNGTLTPAAWGDALTEFTLTGTSNSFQIGSTGISMAFSTTPAGVLSNMTSTLTGGAWNIDGIDWFGLSDPFIGIQVYEGNLPVVGAIGGTIKTGKPITVSMDYPIANNTWLLTATPDLPYPSISNFYQLVGGVNLTTALPQPFSTLTDLGLREIDIQYDSAAKNVGYISVNIATDPAYQWQILPKLTVSNIDISCIVSNPGNSQSRSTSFTITGNFTIGAAGANTLVVTATVPNFSADVVLTDGAIQLGDLLTMFWSDATLNLQSQITVFNLQIAPTQKNYTLSCDITTDWTFFSIQSPVFSLTMTGMSLNISSQQGTTTGKITGLFHIGAASPSGVDLTMFAGYDGKAWAFGASTGIDQTISLGDIATSFLNAFGLGNIPTWVSNNLPDISNLVFVATVPTDKKQPASYQIQGDVDWQLQFGSFNLSLAASVDITYQSGAPSGTITGTADASKMLGLTFIVGYKFGEADTEVYLQIPQFSSTITYTKNAQFDQIDIKFDKISLGQIITVLVGTFDPGFSLPSPWDVLNDIDLSGLEFTYTRYPDASKSTIKATIPIKVDLVFINITNLVITKEGASSGGSGVYMYIEGTFLGLPIDSSSPLQKDGKGADATKMPAVPGMGDSLFDLKLLALGQHVSMYDPGAINTVDQAITALGNAFTTTSDPNSTTIPVPASSTTPGTLVFDQNSNWLIGADFTVAKFYRVAVVFNDPNMYGLLVGIDPAADYFKNLQFEILYKKINDSIGVYQLDLQLPDQWRHLEFGEVSITLPLIGVKIYTNGNFYFDFGFPASITDFSRSFSIQVFPFVGYGGFYFGYLSGATSTAVPATSCGVFSPVIVFGLGLSLGVGKTFEQGILKAGLSLTAVGIFQGVVGFFRANTALQTSDATYYKLQGTFGLTGHIYGEINFAIISARLDIMAYAYATITIESYMPIPISFEAGVSVSLTVSINLGLFSISVSLHFSATVSASFVIGSDTTANAPWNICPVKQHAGELMAAAMPAKFLSAPPANQNIKWQPIVPAAAVPLNIVFIPHLTVSGDGPLPGPQYVGMLYINTADASVTGLATGILYWTLNALIGNTAANTGLAWLQGQTITLDEAEQLLCYFSTRPDNVAPFNYQNTAKCDIETFLSTYFVLNISAADPKVTTNMQGSVFPILPEMQLSSTYNSGSPVVTEPAQTGTQNYISDISALLASMGVAYESAMTKEVYKPSICDNLVDPNYENQPNLSFPTFIFTDFIALIAKQLLQATADYLKQNGQSATVLSAVTGAVQNTVQGIGGMASRFMLYGMRLPVPPDASTGAVQPLYALTGQQIAFPATLKKGDKYAVSLQGPAGAWINMVKGTNQTISISVDDNEIHHILDIKATTLAPKLLSGPSPILNFNDTPQSFTLGNPALWQYPDDLFSGVKGYPHLWHLPSNLSAVFNAGGNPQFSLDTITKTSSGIQKGVIANALWSTSVSITLQRINAPGGFNTPLSANMYNLVGADDAGIVFLEDLISYLNTHSDSDGAKTIQQIQVLYQPDPVTNSKGGFVSAANNGFSAAIVQANLSTETNPITMLAARAAVPQPVRSYNTLNEAGDFIKLLWECSIVRSGGFYFYYNTSANAGLPDSLFNSNGLAELTLVITYDNLIIAPFVNSVVIGDQLDLSITSVYAQSPDITTRVATILPGNIGYQLSRPCPDPYAPSQPYPTLQQDQIYLQYQFNLIGALLPAIPAYQNLLPSGPADPMSEGDIAAAKAAVNAPAGDATDWNYRAVIPYYQYVQPAGTSKAYPNPYAGIGNAVTIALNWQDMFGNVPPAGAQGLSVNTQVLYSDMIVALNQWPSVSINYLFNSLSNAPNLALSFTFNTSRYTGKGAVNNAQIDLAVYMKLFYQLSNADMVISFTTSIENSATTPVNHTLNIPLLLNTFINPVITMLNTVAGGGASTAIPDYVVITPVATTAITTLPEILLLTVEMSMQRIANIDPNFTNVAGVASASIAIQPLSQDTSGATSKLSLSYFAGQFEGAFVNLPANGVVLKVATGTNMTKANTDSSGAPLWIVRFDTTGVNGIKFSFDSSQLYYYAPAPLATSLQAFTADISPYSPSQAYPAGQAVTKNYSAIDVDNWALQFLQAIDKLLGPDYAVPAFLLHALKVFKGDGDYLQNVLDSKQAIADAIKTSVDFIIETSTADALNKSNAQEKWRQQLLIQLSNAYRYVASVQTNATISSGYTGVNSDPQKAPYVPALYGNMAGQDPSVPGSATAPKSTEYSLSTAKVPIAKGTSYLTFLFEAKDAANSRSFAFGDMQYQVSHIEFDIQAVPDMNDYLASSWLAFIIPINSAGSPLLSMGDIGSTQIPVPLRAYPTPPSISVQNFDYQPALGGQATVTSMRDWTYCYTYQNPSAAQDTVLTKIQFNVTQAQQDSNVKNNAKKLPVYQALAQFISVYPAISADLDSAIAQLTPATMVSTSSDAIKARYALLAFISIVNDVAAALTAVQSTTLATPATPYTLSYKITESAQSITNYLVVTVNAQDSPSMAQAISVNIDGYTALPVTGQKDAFVYYKTNPGGTKTYLDYSKRNDQPSRTISVAGLDILNTQNAWSSVAVLRNEELLQNKDGSWQKTNPDFIYQTPQVMFYNKLIPLLNNPDAIDIATIGTKSYPVQPTRTLQNHLLALCDALTQQTTNPYTIKMQCDYTYIIPGTNLPVDVPVLLLTPTDIDPADHGSAVANVIYNGLSAWMANNPQSNGGSYLFNMVAYSGTDNFVPVLQSSFTLSLTNIT